MGLVVLGVHALLIVYPGAAYGTTPAPTGDVNSELPWHPAVVDPQRGLLAWYRPQQNLGFDEVLHLGWNFIEHKIPDERGTKLKTYIVNSVFNGETLQGEYWQSNPAMTFGSFVDSAAAWYPYSGVTRRDPDGRHHARLRLGTWHHTCQLELGEGAVSHRLRQST